jgi:hypothetical protein
MMEGLTKEDKSCERLSVLVNEIYDICAKHKINVDGFIAEIEICVEHIKHKLLRKDWDSELY